MSHFSNGISSQPIAACVRNTFLAWYGTGRILTLPRVLHLLKHGPGAQLKADLYAYQMALNKKMVRIERIHELWTQMLGLICTAIARRPFSPSAAPSAPGC